jgi:hypothetical protein
MAHLGEAVLLSPAERSLRARIGAHSAHAAGRTNTAPARTAFLESFIDRVDPDRTLSEAERLRRAKHARRAHMLKLALSSARARRRGEARRG